MKLKRTKAEDRPSVVAYVRLSPRTVRALRRTAKTMGWPLSTTLRHYVEDATETAPE